MNHPGMLREAQTTGNLGEAYAPAPPVNLEQTELPFFFLVELTAKILFKGGPQRQGELVDSVKLLPGVLEPVLDFMRAEHLIEVQPRTQGDSVMAAGKELTFALTDMGRQRASDAMARSQYAGPAPVSLRTYERQVRLQSMADVEVTRADITRVFDGVVIKPELLDQFGAAMNSRRASFVYGPAGAGKTYIAERLIGLLDGGIYIPHAILVDGEVVQVFDPLVHAPLADSQRPHSMLERRGFHDARWVACERPVVLCGGELSLSMLDLQFDREARYYTAPPQVKANNGLLIIDDLGRQLAEPRAIMNRWIVPMDRQVDYLALHTGGKFQVPFDVNLVFSTNLQPSALADEAFLRRLGYKIYVGPIEASDYEGIFRQECTRLGIPFTPEGLAYVLQRHEREERPLLACSPRDLLGQLRDQARFRSLRPEMSESLLDWAWNNYFVRN
jgi:DNA-binding PadR family transcriptional regulator